MKFKTFYGKTKNINISKYRINWDAKEKSNIQFQVKRFLYPYWMNHIVCSEFPVVSSKMTLDFYNLTRGIAIEVQGSQHVQYNAFFHNDKLSNFLSQLKRDVKKEEFCELNGIKLVEIFEEDIKEGLSKNWFLEKYNINL